ncbi:MAG: hypothetical protein ACXACG_06370 [Candidatus Thorarchaeota archaeon]
MAEKFVKLCGEVGNFTQRHTGISIVDAYIGPDEFHPKKQSKEKTAAGLVHDIHLAFDVLRDEIEDEIRLEYMMGELHSLNVVVDWLGKKDVSYSDLVEGLFHIPMKKYSESEIDKSIEIVTNVMSDFPGDDLHDKIKRFGDEGEITGETLQRLIEDELQKRSREVGEEFRNKIYRIMGASVPDKGVQYETVRGESWSGYNWYQGQFKSLNQFNIDRKFNRDTLQSTIYHEYEHHVSNLWREKAFLKTGNLELSIVPLHTGRCVISEGTADTAKDFLEVPEDDPRIVVLNALYPLRRMTSINAAILLNDEGRSLDEAVDYLTQRGYRSQKSAESSIAFISPTTKDGKTNIFAPYIFTYFIGRTKFVHPTFIKASEEGVLPEFFKTVYMNPYSGSSVTWNKAFEWM